MILFQTNSLIKLQGFYLVGYIRVLRFILFPWKMAQNYYQILTNILTCIFFQNLDEKSLLSERQFGFRPSYSTELAVFHYLNNFFHKWMQKNTGKYFSNIYFITLYNSMIFPHFNYCLLTWGSNTQDTVFPQMNAIRILSPSFSSHWASV